MSGKIYNFTKKSRRSKAPYLVNLLETGESRSVINKLRQPDHIRDIMTVSERPVTGDFIKIKETLYPGYKTKIFKVIGHIDSGTYQICIQPLSEKDRPIGKVWVMYDESSHFKISDLKYLEILNALF